MRSDLRILMVHCSYRFFGGEDQVFFQERDALREKLGPAAVIDYHVQTSLGNPWSMLLQLFFPFWHGRRIRKLIRDNRIDLVHVHNHFPLLTLSVFKAARQAGVVVVHTLHNYRWWCLGAELYRKEQGICELCVAKKNSLNAIRYRCYRSSRTQSLLAAGLMGLIKKKAFTSYIDHFIALSSFQRDWVIKAGVSEKKVVLKPNGVTAYSVCSADKKNGFVYAGRLEHAKGIEELLRCWQEHAISETLTVIGSGTLEHTLKSKYAFLKQVRFMGACSPEETRSLIDRSRYLIHPSLWYETFGLTMVEAMQLGVPVIGFAIGTRPDFIKDGENGFLCLPDTLGVTLQKAISFNDYSKLSIRAQETGRLFLADALIDKQLQLYQGWVAQKHS